MSYTCTGAFDSAPLGLLATGLWVNSLNQPANISSLTISGWFAQDYVVGQLNAKISTCYSGVSGWAICPSLDSSELAILGAMYLTTYWGQQVAGAVGAGGTNLFTSAADGDRRFTKTSVSELMKIYKDMARQANEQLNYLTNEYIRNGQGANLPRSIDYLSFYNGTTYNI